MKKQTTITLLTVVAIFLVLITISQIIFASIPKERIRSDPIYLVVDTWAGFTPLYVAYENGFFDDERVLVKFDILTNTQTIGNELAKKDCPYDGYPQVYPQMVGGGYIDTSSKAVYAFDYSYSGDVIVADKSIESIADLKNKTVGIIGNGSFSYMFLLELLKKVNMTEEDVNIVVVPAYDVLDAIKSGKIDAGHTWDPVKTQALEEGYSLVGSSEETPGLITDILAIKSDVIRERPEDVQKIVNALVRAYRFMEENGGEAYSVMSNKTGVSLDELIAASKGIRMLSPEDNIIVLTDSGDPSSLYETSKLVSNFLISQGRLNESFSAEDLIDSSFVEKAIENEKMKSEDIYW